MGPGWIVEKGHRFNLHPSLHPWLHMAISGQLRVSDDPGWNIILVLVIVSFLLIITGCIDDFWPDSPWWYYRSLRRHWIIYSQERVCGDGFPNIKTSTPILGSHLGKHYLMVSSTSPAAPSSYHQHQPLEEKESMKNTTISICHTIVSIMWITTHTSYLSQTPQTCLCKNFLSGVNFSRMSEKNAYIWLFQRHL